MTAPRLKLLGRLVDASNGTFLCEEAGGERWVYKPVAGEAPLWDFPHQTLGRREVAAFELSRAAGFDVVPETLWLDDGPLGPGSAQRWLAAAEADLVGLVRLDEAPDDWFAIVVGVDEDDADVALVHPDEAALRRLALFDAVSNNSDRKGAHCLRAGDRVWGIDHGVCFHVDDKLRTVLWGWSGEALQGDEIALLHGADDVIDEVLSNWLAPGELEACHERIDRLLGRGCLPEPQADWPAIPWPPV